MGFNFADLLIHEILTFRGNLKTKRYTKSADESIFKLCVRASKIEHENKAKT